jgi:hypothetical protein
VVFVVRADGHTYLVAIGHGPEHDEVVAALQEMGATVVAGHRGTCRAAGGLRHRIRSARQDVR